MGVGLVHKIPDFAFEKLIAVIIAAGVGGLVFTIGHWILYVLGVGATTAAVSDAIGIVTSGCRHATSGSAIWLPAPSSCTKRRCPRR